MAAALVAWQRQAGRHDLPWQADTDPYRVWVSEIMLQQTQVTTVIGYYQRFLARFPSVAALAAADDDAVLAAWSGLGYYSRARNLRAAARRIADHGWPEDVAGLAALPGIGESTAAAIATFCFGRREAILDGNVRRVYGRYLGIEAEGGDPRSRASTQRLWAFARAVMADPGLADRDAPVLIQGLMDLGASVCARARPDCRRCPLQPGCSGSSTALLPASRHATGRVSGGAPGREPGRESEGRGGDKSGASSASRGRRVVPLRQYRLLLLVGPDATGRAGVWLERRPAAGLWGGLWSLPELGEPVPLGAGQDDVVMPEAATQGGADRVSETVVAKVATQVKDRVAETAAAIARRLASLGGAAEAIPLDAASRDVSPPDAVRRPLVDPNPVEAAARLPVTRFEHQFTHFRMRALVHGIALSGAPPRVSDDGSAGGWVHLVLEPAAIAAAPLATPVRALLLRCAEGRVDG